MPFFVECERIGSTTVAGGVLLAEVFGEGAEGGNA